MHDVIVVGAGLAGVALARALDEACVDVVVLESRGRVGGRIFGHSTDHGRYDLGPAWIWPGMQPLVGAAVAEAGLAIYEQDDHGGFLFQDRTGAIQRLPHGFEQDPPSMRIAGGINALLEFHTQQLPSSRIRLNHRVTGLAVGSAAVTLDCATPDGTCTLSARHVALALPPRLIARLDFSPALPEAIRRRFAAVPTWMAGHAKALAIYDRPFWRENGLSGAAISHIGPLAELHDASLPGVTAEAALFGFFSWPAAMRAARQATLPASITAQLAALFGPQGAKPRQLIVHDWADEELTATHEDRVGPAQHPHYEPITLPEPWAGLVLASGSESAPEFGGYLEGALAAAAAAASRLLTPRSPHPGEPPTPR
ncbi:flavin monoamine oxidase family protein [Acidiphilium sp.]|uniref:flavin monoamine oxidase family protein n=1 Tax=Acidiphilium sp. TaxID=527 RepID=UPI003D023B1A